MAVIENRTTEIGDVLVIQVEVPLIGLLLLSDFIDTVVGETATRYFYKEFRYKVDAINWSAWIELTTANVSAVQTEPTFAFFVEYRYIRSGTDHSGELEFDDITLQGQYVSSECPAVYNNSIFAQFFSCASIDVLNWCINVLEKIYKPGIVPEYIIRGENNNFNWEDKDYLNFWRSITCYFSLFVNYVRQFENFTGNQQLLTEYVRNKGLFVCDSIEQEDLIYLVNNLYNEFRFRGTLQVAVSSEDSGRQVSGELLRLLCKKECDEFIFSLVEPWKIGFNIGSSSPMYRGIKNMFNVIKGYENTQDFVDLNNYPLNNDSYCSIVTDGGRDVLQITGVPLNEQSGIFPDGSDLSKKIKVDNTVDYEITFLVKQETLVQNISFAVAAYDINDNMISLYNAVTGALEVGVGLFFNRIQLNIVDTWYFIRGVIFNKDKSLLPSLEGTLNIGYGEHLKFGSVNPCYIVPVLILNNNSEAFSSTIKVWDFKVRPLVTDQSFGFLGVKNLILTWLKNNSGKYSDDQVEQIIREYLIPYNSTIKNKFI